VSPRLLHILALATACQSRPSESAPARPEAIEVRVAGALTARVLPGHPCRATVEGLELLVGGRPLIAQLGDARWTGDDGSNGTTLRMNNEVMARILDDRGTPGVSAAEGRRGSIDSKPGTLALFDATGIALIRATLDPDGKRVTVADRAGAVVRYIARTGTGLVVQPVGTAPAPTVTGTDDLLLAAALTATEALPEVRGLSACHRLFPIDKAP
jgi:hypothetical protein